MRGVHSRRSACDRLASRSSARFLPSRGPDPVAHRSRRRRRGRLAARARQLALQGRSTIIVEARRGAGGTKVRLFDPAGGLPQSIQFGMSSSKECAALIAYIRGLRPARMEILDPGALPISLMRLLLAIEAPHDLLIADAGLLDRRGDSLASIATPSRRDANMARRLAGGRRKGETHSCAVRTGAGVRHGPLSGAENPAHRFLHEQTERRAAISTAKPTRAALASLPCDPAPTSSVRSSKSRACSGSAGPTLRSSCSARRSTISR